MTASATPGSQVIPAAHMVSMDTQLTLHGLVDALWTVPPDAIVMISGFGSATNPGVLFRHRQFADGLSVSLRIGEATRVTTAELIETLLEQGPGRIWDRNGHPGFVDTHPAGPTTPMWAGSEYELSFRAVTGVEMIKGFAVIRTTDLAPVQGPSLQRIPDEEVINRMRVADLELHGREMHLHPAAERHLINYIPKDRTSVLHSLAAARVELDGFEASLQAKRDRVTKLERDAARHDYLLGIRDDLPGEGAGCNGVCHRASDVGMGVAGDPVAYAHDSCPEHGGAADE